MLLNVDKFTHKYLDIVVRVRGWIKINIYMMDNNFCSIIFFYFYTCIMRMFSRKSYQIYKQYTYILDYFPLFVVSYYEKDTRTIFLVS